jgi:hypothetical protein
MNRTVSIVTVCSMALLMAVGCNYTRNKFWSAFGYEQRDLLVSDVKKARDGQDAAAKQIQTTLDTFKELTHFNGGDLEAAYNKLNASYEKSESRAKDVRDRIAKVEYTANKMFAEWNSELSQYSDPKLRAESEQELNATKHRYNQLIGLMKSSSAKMDPVLAVFKDHVLELKHKLNAAAIASLSGTATELDAEVQSLIKDMQASIKEADDFIGRMKD